jgi:hypothetical protein
MVINRSPPRHMPLWGVKIVEWTLLLSVVFVLVWVFARQVQVLQGQAELEAVRSTLGALRTALVIDHLKQKIAGKDSAASRRTSNPFELLQ